MVNHRSEGANVAEVGRSVNPSEKLEGSRWKVENKLIP